MPLPASVEKFLTERAVPYQTLTHRKAFTAQEEAAVAHVPGREWAKAVVCFADGEPLMAIVPAPYNVDIDRLRQLVGARALRLAQEREFSGLYPECEPGAMPPFGPLYGQRVFVDKTLAADPEIVFNAGTHVDAIRMRYADFARVSGAVVGDFAVALHTVA